MSRLLAVTALVLALAVGCGSDDDDGGGPTHQELADRMGCTLYETESAPLTMGEMMDCRFSDEREEGDYVDRVHVRVFEINDDRDEDLEMIRGVCEGFSTGDPVTVFEGDRWLINAEMSTEVSRRIAEGLDVEPDEVEC